MEKESSLRPYLAGALAGILAIVSVWGSTVLLDKPMYLGASTSFVRMAGMAEAAVAEDHVKGNAYFQSKKVRVDWQLMMVVGIGLGALGAGVVRREIRLEAVPPIWIDRFGPSIPWRAITAFAGGVVAMFGARLAGGCPSGHGLSGLMQLSASGFLAMIGFFGGGVVVANWVYRSKKGV